MEDRIDHMEKKLNSTYDMVKEIHGIVIGNDYNKNDSLLMKMLNMQKEVDDLKSDKLKRDYTNKFLIAIAGFIGTAIGAILVAWLTSYFKYIH